MHTITYWVTQEIAENVAWRRTIVRRAYTIPLDNVYCKHDPLGLNVVTFLIPEEVSFYVKI